jgi:hypothetical protein
MERKNCSKNVFIAILLCLFIVILPVKNVLVTRALVRNKYSLNYTFIIMFIKTIF